MAELGHRYKRAPSGDNQESSRGSSTQDQHPPALSSTPSMQRRRGLVSDAATPFSWVQCAISTFAYVWMLSNFLRTGFAIHSLDGFTVIEPNVRISFGPYAYPMSTLFKNGADLSNVTSVDPIALWGYKYDTTSIDMRTFAQFLNVSAFPDCVLYRGKCTSEFLAPMTALVMLDSLVDAVRNASTQHPRVSKLPTQDPKYKQLQPQKLLLRASYDYFDRIHHYMLPQLFSSPNWRTCEAVHYSPELLSLVAASSSIGFADKPLHDQGDNNNNNTLVDICSYAYGGVRPYFCNELWTRFDRSCPESDAECRSIGHVSTHTMQRLEAFKASNPDATVDLLILNGSDDLNINRGGFTFVAKRGFDVVTIFRARSCSEDGVCETQVLDEYRYEGETFTSDILQWYPIVATLRGAAQSYYWLRLVMLYCGCYYAVTVTSKGSPSQSSLSTVRRAFAAFFKIPSQVVIYGSAFPLVCYVSAHIIDSPMVYELMAQKFDSFNGLFQLSLTELITIGSLQMRNVWLLANVIHVVVHMATRRRWSPVHGVWGMPQFAIAMISSLTICSQFRFLSLRQTPVKRILHLQVTSRLHPGLEAILHVNGGGGKAQLAGIFLDAKALVCSVALLGFSAAIVSLTLKAVCTKLRIKFVFLRAHSTTPLSAGILWPATALAVCWDDDLTQVQQVSHHATLKQPRPFSTKIQPAKSQQLASSSRPIKPMTLDDRSEAEESEMYLMNITMLSDPITYLLWRWSSSTTRIGYYRSAATQQVYLVPRIHTLHQSELSWRGFTLEKTVSADELAWSEIITCG